MSRGPIILAIDTATATTGIAIFGGTVLAEHIWRSARNQTRELLPAMHWLLRQQDLTIADVSAITVSLGPGTFNGLRVGISMAKALAFARGIPCFGVGTLEATAYEFSWAERMIRPVYDAGRGEIATGLYQREGDILRCLEAPRLSTIHLLAIEINQATLVCGELRADWVKDLSDALGSLVSFPRAAGAARRPSHLAEIGWSRLMNETGDDVLSLQPIYLRRPAISVPRAQ